MSSSLGNAAIRINAPPGGKTSDIFGTGADPTASPRRLNKEYQKSTIFDETDANSNVRKPVTPKHQPNTQTRLFGEGDGVPKSPRRLTDTFKSSVFTEDNSPLPKSPARTPKKKIERNPITGDTKMLNGEAKLTNGEAMTNGYVNGEHKTPQKGGFSGGVTC